MLRDRDYIEDRNGIILKVVGDYHPKDNIISYVKYYPSPLGDRELNGRLYGYNSFVPKSFVILQDFANRETFSIKHGGILTSTPKKGITKIYSCRKKLNEILQKKKKYSHHRVGAELVNVLEKMGEYVDLSEVGITGSFLIDIFNDSSDIDLVCYGGKTTKAIRRFFQDTPYIQQYQGSLAKHLYTRRMTYMAPIDFDMLIKQENRKIQGITRENGIHINCQPLRSDTSTKNIFHDIEFLEVGSISCIAEITDNKEGVFAPAFYEIKVLDILESLFSDGGKNFHKKIKCLISFIGAYSSSFEKGDRVFLKGKLVKIQKGGDLFFGVELTPWNTTLSYQASLIK